MTAESHCSPTGISLEDTGYGYTLSVINGKYKMIILYWLALYKPVLRFNELQRCIGTISYKTLSSTLKELEKDRLVVRKEYPQIPPKVEYSLSERGRSLIPVIDMMCNWGAAPAGTAGAVRNDLGRLVGAARCSASAQRTEPDGQEIRFILQRRVRLHLRQWPQHHLRSTTAGNKMAASAAHFFRLSRRLYSCFSSRKCLYTVARPIDSTLAM